MSAPGLRVLIVDDDPAYRHILSRIFEQMPQVESVAVAANLTIARTKLEQAEIDLVTIDVILRDESGLDLLPWIHARSPDLFTILLTSGTHREASQAVDALLLGASTLIIKPTGDHAPVQLTNALKSAVSAVKRRAGKSEKVREERPGAPRSEAAVRELIAVGASTGGPPVVLQFLIDLPASFNVPIVLTQHMPSLHVPYFVELLARQSGRRVSIGVHGQRVERGCVYVAGDARHLLVDRSGESLILIQDEGPEEHNCRPAVDPMFRSVAKACGGASVGVVMTGMGADGALGAVALRARGAPVVAQDQQTSVVWGMPGAVAAAGAASAVVPAAELAKYVVRWTAQTGGQS